MSLDNDVSLDYLQTDKPIEQQHYAFLITEAEFDAVLGRIIDRGITHWADPGRKRAGEISRNDGGRGVYFNDPDGHLLELSFGQDVERIVANHEIMPQTTNN